MHGIYGSLGPAPCMRSCMAIITSLTIYGHGDAAAVMTCRECKASIFNFMLKYVKYACLVAGISIVIDEQVAPASFLESIKLRFNISRNISSLELAMGTCNL